MSARLDYCLDESMGIIDTFSSADFGETELR